MLTWKEVEAGAERLKEKALRRRKIKEEIYNRKVKAEAGRSHRKSYRKWVELNRLRLSQYHQEWRKKHPGYWKRFKRREEIPS